MNCVHFDRNVEVMLRLNLRDTTATVLRLVIKLSWNGHIQSN